jgi:hypothetical protein
MRKDLTIYTLAILLGFVMGLFTCKTCGREKDCPPCIEPLDGGQIVSSDTTTTIKRDSAKSGKVEPVRIVLPTLAAGHPPTVIYKPMPVYMPADTAAVIAQYKGLYEDYTTLKEYDNTYPFGSDTVRIKQSIQGNDLWEQNVYLVHAGNIIRERYAVPAKPRNSVWWGASGYYREGEIGAGSSLMFLHKKGFAIEAGAAIGTGGLPTYSTGMKWKIGAK